MFPLEHEASIEVPEAFDDARLRECFGGDPAFALHGLTHLLEMTGEWHARGDRRGMRDALIFLTTLCSERGAKHAAQMFAQFADALDGLNRGIASPLFERTHYGNRAPDARRRVRVIVLALECVKRLRELTSMGTCEAQREVAQWLNALNFPVQAQPGRGRPRPCTAVTLKNWQNSHGRDVSLDHVREAFKPALEAFGSAADLRHGLERFVKDYS